MLKKNKWLIVFIVVALVVVIALSFATFKTSKKGTSESGETLAAETQKQPTQGKKGAKVLLVEFGDFKCPYCGDFERKIKPQLEKEYIDNKKVEFRYVNVLIHGDESELGAKAALAVNQYAPEKYWQFHHALFEQQPKNKDDVGSQHWLTDDLIQKQLQKLGLSEQERKQITAAYRDKNGEMAKRAQEDHTLAKKEEVPYVPALYVNGKRIEDETDFDAIKKEVDKALEE
ncbi:DsbA family protein [Staphylococcus intermedius]|uniref:Protein-disulfide isomerase n=1 Tax=Staphylococcus intermedius NCTC 11048 TaxID=1141106 RepID=A0A380G2L6_STAIN|nr:thioredoxin domain-containing protein [Staphylococcus intermedius]PCF64263.1 protein-disulfide isomerase [Staphylococcus intermedius]PCF78979.1 protein-disulfide isomerase [Staphylococcus intermedius]PCF79951.1 protein-disulfide isomerase [Staphylococcus intermedius]PCF89389.1 protein-disulfide isomerase [Staphylococcus intermedius]PNZ50866.1 protein-disulfide isomerase [Staphylococcus intermedius NCTC 11048]